MSIIAGAFSRREALPGNLIRDLKKHISRFPADVPLVYEDDRCCLIKVDIGAYGEPAFDQSASGRVAILAGEPRLDLDEESPLQTRTRDLQLLTETWARSDWSLTAKARGVFCAAHYEAERGRLVLVADKLSLRPIYFWADERLVVFASSLRILEELAEVSKRADLRGLAEMIAFGFPLADRTPYTGIVRLRAAEIAEIDATRVTRSQYWRWDSLAPTTDSHEEAVRSVYGAFTNSVACLQRSDQSAVSLLSGGLDSRCIVGALRDLNRNVHTLNFSPQRSQDQVYAKEFARAIGSIHKDLGLPADVRDHSLAMLLERGWPIPPQVELAPERPRLVWSGDGGSVGLGGAYITRSVERHLISGDMRQAAQAYIDAYKMWVPVRVLCRDWRVRLGSAPLEGIMDELADISVKDPIRRFHIFLMLNDQRRHLTSKYELIDLHRFEFQVPFFDSRFLEAVYTMPTEWLLYHRFYLKWLKAFPPAVTAVPWQSYPEHEPCPIEISTELSNQWDQDVVLRLSKFRGNKAFSLMKGVLQERRTVSRVVSVGWLRLFYALHRLGYRDFGYIFSAVLTLSKHLSQSSGDFDWPNRAIQQLPAKT